VGVDESKEEKKEDTATAQSYPKVIITTRSELLQGVSNYTLSFLPLESENVKKDEVEEVSPHLLAHASYRAAAHR
jgi:hypothetical protein